jgi:hypothetical protein
MNNEEDKTIDRFIAKSQSNVKFEEQYKTIFDNLVK